MKKKLKTLEKILESWSEKLEKLFKRALMSALDMSLTVSVLVLEGKDKVKKKSAILLVSHSVLLRGVNKISSTGHRTFTG